MPLYEFLCESCGSFDRSRPLGEANDPMPCPGCGAQTRRVFSMPGVISTSAEVKKARSLNERGAEPKLIKRRDSEKDAAPRSVRGRPWQIEH